MDNATLSAVEGYADALLNGDDEAVTATATTLLDALDYDQTGDDFTQAVLEAAVQEEVVDRVRCAAVIRAAVGL